MKVIPGVMVLLTMACSGVQNATMINELYVAVFTAFITGLTEPFLVGSSVHFQRGNFHYF